ncbi:FRG domain-containing protein [Bacillus sp. AY18-3]|uniref:FRG domain-containing protein n=1 Tax=Bacillus sp. AY18-3 TaxID=2217814 RepID=UPI0011C75372|nr:FRG domain-containing protein [Bacillus sp. AY18-3]TXR59012.1 FRG domain-containing protein [Bacillus sp. AY18-3]
MNIENESKIFCERWNEILEIVANFRRNSLGNWVWFRGHNDCDYKLDSGLFRVYDNSNKLGLNDYLRIEQRLGVNFKNQSSSFLKEDNWNMKFYMQHHGLKTRLLDWTDSFITSLYFAFDGWDYDSEKNACIWLLDPHALNLYFHKSTSILTAESLISIYGDKDIARIFYEKENKLNNSFAMYPSKNNPRLLLQNGFFTVQSNSLKDLETEIDSVCLEHKSKILKKIIISPHLVENVYEYLTMNGINHFTVYNDIDGLSHYLNVELTNNIYNEKLKYIAKFNGKAKLNR